MAAVTPVFRRAGWLLAAVPFFGISTGALFPLVALELGHLGFGETLVGAVTSLYYAGSVTGALTYGWVLNRLGYKISFLAVALLAGIASYSLTQTHEPILWLSLRFLGGFALGGYYIVVDSWVSALGTRSTRGRLFASYETLRLLATAIGPSLIVVGATTASLTVVAIGYTVSFVPALLNEAPCPNARDRILSGDLGKIVRCFPFALAIAFCGGAANASFYGLSALYAKSLGFDTALVALFVTIVLVAPALSEIPIGIIADRLRRMPVAASAALLAALSSTFLVIGSPSDFWVATLASVIVGGCLVPLYALGLSRIVDSLGEQDVVLATTGGLLAYNAGALCGPLSAGFVMEHSGPMGLYLFLGGLATASALLAIADTQASECCPERLAEPQA